MLQDKTAVVTGANRGIGKAILETFAKHGCSSFACSRTIDSGFLADIEHLSLENHVRIQPVSLDLGDPDSIKSAARTILADAGELNVLVNNAGVASGGLFQMTPIEEIRRNFEINFFSQLHFTQLLLRKMTRQKSGSIINVSSTASEIADPGTLVYGSGKAALSRATQSLATELGAFNIRANAILPGVTQTDMYDQMAEEARERLIQRSALKRAATPEDIANAALFLASDLSLHITGQLVRVDGGIV